MSNNNVMPLTVELINNAIKDSFNDYFFLNPEKLNIVERATKAGYIIRLSHTQAQWTEQGLEKAKKELDGLNVYLFKLPTDGELKQGLNVCYEDVNGSFSKVGQIADVIQQDGVNLFVIDGCAYMANELRLIKPEFGRGDFAMVVLGSSKDQIKGDKVMIDDIYTIGDKTKVDATVLATKHKFWCHYSDLKPIK